MIKKTLTFCLFFIIISSLTAKDLRFAAYPMFSYSDESGYLVGLINYSSFQFNSFPDQAQKQRISAVASYTTKHQFEFRFEPVIYSPNSIYKYVLEAKYKFLPSEFYGVGNMDINKEPEKYTEKDLSIKFKLSKRITNSLAISGLTDFYKSQISDKIECGLLDSGSVPGCGKFSIFGFGLGLVLDTRNSDIYPTSGYLLEFDVSNYGEILDDPFPHWRFNFGAKKFLPVSQNSVLAISSNYLKLHGDVPFQKMAKIGDQLRAYPDKLFIDKEMLSSRIEYRLFPFKNKFWQKLGFATFADVGEVAPQTSEFTMSNLHYSIGSGIRITVLPEDRFNLRFDVGFSDYGTSFEISGGEAF